MSGDGELRINKIKVPRVMEDASLDSMLRENLSDETFEKVPQ